MNNEEYIETEFCKFTYMEFVNVSTQHILKWDRKKVDELKSSYITFIHHLMAR